MRVLYIETIKRMEEDNARRKKWSALQMIRLEEAADAVEEKSAELKRELEKSDAHNDVRDLLNAVICKSANEGINNDLMECLKKNTSLEDNLALMNTRIVDK